MRLRVALLTLFAGVAALVMGVSPATCATRHVVLLFDERSTLPGLAAVEADLIATLTANSPDPIEIYSEDMDLSRFGQNAYPALMRDFLRAKYADKKIDLVVAVMGPALAFLMGEGKDVFPGAAIVFCGIDRRELGDRALSAHVHGILVKRAFAPTLEIALSLHPDTKQVVVVAGTSGFDTHVLQDARRELLPFEQKFAFRYLTTLPLAALLKELSTLPPQTIVLFTTFFQDGAGQPFVPHDVVQRISAASNAPVYGFVDQYLGRGIVGGSLYSLRAHGAQAGKLAREVLAGTRNSGPTLLEVPATKPAFDWRQLQRWNIRASMLPPGSDLHFRSVSVWERYRWQITAAVLALVLQAALISGLLYERWKRLRSEASAHELSGQMIHAQEDERARLARELHDDVTQRLASLAIEAGSAERKMPVPVDGQMRSMREGLVRLSEDVHALSYRLHPSVLEDLGLIEALKSECERFSQTCATDLKLDTAEAPRTPRREVALCVFRIAQEALRNIARHSGAASAQVSLRQVGDRLQLTVRDDGVGFDPQARRDRASLGLASMRQRAFLLGGTVKLNSRCGRGTTVTVSIPIKESIGEPPARAAG